MCFKDIKCLKEERENTRRKRSDQRGDLQSPPRADSNAVLEQRDKNNKRKE